MLKFLICLEQEAPHFHFILDSGFYNQSCWEHTSVITCIGLELLVEGIIKKILSKIIILTKNIYMHSYTHAHAQLHESFDIGQRLFSCHLSYIEHTLNASSVISCFYFFKVKVEVKDRVEKKSDCRILLEFYNPFSNILELFHSLLRKFWYLTFISSF